MTNKELEEKILEKVYYNHIWLNAFNTIKPTDEFCMELGKTIVDMIKTRENLLPSYHGSSEGEVDEIQELSKALYLRINAS